MQQPSPSTLRLTIILGTLAAFGPLSVDMYLSGLPALAREFGSDASAAQLTLSLFFIGLALGQVLYGPISDRFGRRGPLLVGCTIYALASLACALAPSIGSLIALRCAQALGACAGQVISRSVVRDLFDARGSARMYSFLMLVTGLAPITAPLIGGQIIALAGWRAIFWLLCGFGLLCMALVLFGLPETLPRERRVTAGLGQALATYGRLLVDRQFLGYALAGGCMFAGMFAYISGSPFVLIELYGVAPERFGWVFGANALGLVAASQLNRRLLARYSSDTIMLFGLALSSASSLLLLAAAISGFGGLLGLLAPLFICVGCVGLVSPNSSAGAMAPHGAIAGSASALMGTLQFVVGALAGALVGAWHNSSAVPMAAVIAGCTLAALAIFLGLAGRAPRAATA